MRAWGWIIAAALVVAGCGAKSDNLGTSESAAQTVEAADLGGVPNVTRYGTLWFSGQPGADDWRAVKDAGIAHVVDLRNRTENRGHNQDDVLEGLDLKYSIHPVRAEEFSRAVVEPVLKIMSAAAESGDDVLIQCASSNRSGALLAIWRYRQGDSMEQAIELGRQAGMTSEERNARAYMEQHGR